MVLEAPRVEALQKELDRLRVEIADLRASRERLVLAADADRSRIERELHEGVQQRLVALAVNLQLADLGVDADPATAKALLEEMGRDVQQALEEAAGLAQRIYPAALDAASLGARLRSAAANAGVPASIDIDARSNYPPDVALTVYLCWLDMLARGSGDTRATITAREAEDALAFEIVGNAARSDADLDRTRDRVEALGGRLAIAPSQDGGTRVSGSLPLSR